MVELQRNNWLRKVVKYCYMAGVKMRIYVYKSGRREQTVEKNFIVLDLGGTLKTCKQ